MATLVSEPAARVLLFHPSATSWMRYTKIVGGRASRSTAVPHPVASPLVARRIRRRISESAGHLFLYLTDY